MPMYCYRCNRCDEVITEMRLMRDREQAIACDCGGEAIRDLASEGCGSMNQEFGKPIEMFSIAPNDAAEYKQLAEAGATFSPSGAPLARSRAEKKKLMEVVGHVELS